MDVLKSLSWKTLLLANAVAFLMVVGTEDAIASGGWACQDSSSGCACITDTAFIPDGCHETGTPGRTCDSHAECR